MFRTNTLKRYPKKSHFCSATFIHIPLLVPFPVSLHANKGLSIFLPMLPEECFLHVTVSWTFFPTYISCEYYVKVFLFLIGIYCLGNFCQRALQKCFPRSTGAFLPTGCESQLPFLHIYNNSRYYPFIYTQLWVIFEYMFVAFPVGYQIVLSKGEEPNSANHFYPQYPLLSMALRRV